MYPFRLAFDDWTSEKLRTCKPLNTINLLNKTDPLYEFASNLSIDNDVTTIVCHGDDNVLGSVVFKDGEQVENNIFSIEELAKEIASNVKNDVIVLFACRAGFLRSASPAQKLANALGKIVWAPLDDLYVNDSGNYFYVNNDYVEDTESYILSYEYQRKMWLDFQPIK